MLKLEIDKKVYPNGYQALDEIKLDIPCFGLYAIVGESGSGKSTLLNCISGIDEFDGALFYGDREIKTKKQIEQYRREVVSTIFQDFRLLEELSVSDNVALASDIIGKKLQDEEIDDLLISVGLPLEYKQKRISELSYGEMQRIAIARAIAKETKIIVADEPTANLDGENANNVMSLLREIANDKLVLIVTHNMQLVEKYCSGYIELVDGTAVKNTLPECVEDCGEKGAPLVRKTSFSLLGKLIKSQRKNYRKNLVSIFVTIVFLFLTSVGLVFSQVTLQDAMRYTLDSNSKDDRTVYAEFFEKDGYGAKVHIESLGEQIVFSNLQTNSYYPQDLFTTSEYTSYLNSIKSNQTYYGNSAITVYRAIFSNNLQGTGLKLVCGKGELKDGEIIIPSSIADIIIGLGKTTQAFSEEKQIKSYEDLLNSKFAIPKLFDSTPFEVVGIYQSPTRYLTTYGDYQKLKNKDDYDKMIGEVFAYNSVVCCKPDMQKYADGIVLDYGDKKADCLSFASQFAADKEVKIEFEFIGVDGLTNIVENFVKIKYFIMVPLIVLMSALSILLVYITISGNIGRNKDQILTLRALGMSARSTAKIYILSSVTLMIVEIVLVVALTLASVPIINLIISTHYFPRYNFVVFGIKALPLILPSLILATSSICVACISIVKMFRKSVETQVKGG